MRKIARINATLAREDLDDDDIDTSRLALTPGGNRVPRAHEVGSDEDGDSDNRGLRTRSSVPRIKAERFGTASIRGSVVPDTQFSRMDDDEEDG